jgi:hypothetical protein
MIKWQIETLNNCYNTIKEYDNYKYEFFKNILRYIVIDLQYIFLFRFLYDYNWKYDLLKSTLFCITRCCKSVSELAFTYDDLIFNYWLTEPYKIESMINFITTLIKKEKIKFLDLGLIFKMLPSNYQCAGYEINKDLVELGCKMKLDIKEKDILKLKKKDIKDFDVIFFYEPIVNLKNRDIFAKNLSKIIDKQIIIYNQGGGMINNLRNYFEVTYIRNLSGGGLYYLENILKKESAENYMNII